MSRVPGRIAWVVAALVALIGVATLALHTPPVARWGRDWVVRAVRERSGLDLATSRLTYNVATRRVSFDDVRLSAPGHGDEPFFSATRLTVVLPWAVLRGTVRLSDLQVDGGRVRLVREGGTIVNLPPSSGTPPSETPRRLDVRGLHVNGLDVDYVDRTGDVDVQVRNLRAALTERDIRVFAGASGGITAASVAIRMGAQSTTSGGVAGRMAFDGANVSVQELTLPFPEARVTADGRINRVLDDVRFDLGLKGTLDFATIAAWTPPPVPVSGPGTFTGTFVGPLGGYTLGADFQSSAVTIARVPQVSLAGVLTLTSPRAVIEPLTITTPAQGGTNRRGVFDGRFVYEYGEPGGSDFTGTFRDLDLDMALALYDQAPVTAAAWQQGTVSIGRDRRTAPLRMHFTGRSTPLARADRVALDGTWTATLAGERWFVRHDHRLLDSARASGTLQWRAGGDVTTTPLAGPVTLDIADVGAAIRAARRSGIGVSASLVDVTGTARGTLTVGGTLARNVVSGRIESHDLRLPHGAAATASADIVYDEDSLTARTFAVDTPGAHLRGHVRMGMVSSRLAGEFDAAVDSFPEFLAPWIDAAGVSGALQMAGTIGGTTDVPDVPLRLTSTPIAYDSREIGTLSGEGRLLGTDLTIERLVLDQGTGQLRVAGHVDYDTYAYEATIAGKALTVTGPFTGTNVEAVAVDVNYAGGGTLLAPGGAGALTIAPTGGLGDFTGPADVRWQFANGNAAVTAFWPKLRAWAQADVEPRAPYAFRGTAVVSRLDVQPLALSAGALTDAVSGTVDFSAAYEGALSNVADATAFVNVQGVDVSVGGLPVRLERPARVALRGDDVTVDDLAMRLGTSTLAVAGSYRDTGARPLTASLNGDVADFVAMARAFGAVPADTSATGAIAATWESRGGITNVNSTIELKNGTVTVSGVPPVEALTAVATFDGTTVAVDQLSALWQGARLAGRLRLPREFLESETRGRVPRPGRVDLTATGLTERVLANWLPAETLASLTGRVSATLGLDVTTADLAGVQGTLVLDEATVTAAGVPISQSRPARMSIANRALTFDDVEFSAGVPVNVGGGITFGTATQLGVWITGTPGLRPFSVLSPALSVDGAAVLDVWITGSPAAPRVEGRIDLDDAEIVLRDPRVIASEVSGPILFSGDRFTLEGLKGTLNGGEVEASGTVQFSGVDVMTGELTARARGVAVEYPRNVDSEIDSTLVLALGASPIVRGEVRVLRSAYRATISLPALVAFNAAVAEQAAGPSDSDRIRLDIALSTEEDTIVDNNYGRFEAGADVRVQGTIGRPGMTGRVELREGGEIFLLNSLYRLNPSTISFTNPATIEPDLNISLVTQSKGYEDTVTLSGSLERLQTSVTSTNPDADPSLVNVLLGGNPSLTRNDAVALLSGELLGVTGRALGLDSLRVERGFNADTVRQDPGLVAAGDVDAPDTRLTLSKQVRSDVEVIVSRELAGSGGLAALVSYRPWRGVELRGTSRDNTDRVYAIRHELSFGGGAAVAPVRARAKVDVAAVVIEGAAPDEERALRATLRLTPGARFDFRRWRADNDRLLEWYRDRRFFEARVHASRVVSATDGRTVLTYRVVRGPMTELSVTGTAVAPGLRRALEQSWAAAVFDGFRLDDMKRLVALDLVRRNVIGAQVGGAVSQPSSDRKRIDLTVEGGQAVTARTLEFTGATMVPGKELEAAVKARGLADYVWIDQAAMVEPLQKLYSDAGYRAARVTPAPADITAGRAVVRVAVSEGSLTQIASVQLTGVTAELSPSVESIVSGLEGQIYRNTLVDEIRRRIELVYRTRGFNHVEVRPSVTFPDDRRAELVVAVSPGAEQRLRDVVVDGAVRTMPSAVVSALRLPPGAPVDFAQWAQARKRIFDTNVFRQVEVRPEVLPDAEPDGAEAVRARVTVTEWPAWRLRYGVQLNDAAPVDLATDPSAGRTRDFGFVADLQNRNAFGRAFTYGLFGRAERWFQLSNAYFTVPTFFGRAVQTNLFASASTEDTEFDDGEPTFRRTKQLASIEQRVRRGRAMEIGYGYRLSHELLKPFDTDNPFLNDTLIGRFSGSALVDRRDDPFDATRGWFGSLSVQSLSEFGGNSDSVRVLGTYYRYQALSRLTLASAVRVGASWFDPLLFSERFFAGGALTVRGYADDTLGPKNFLGTATGGDSLVVLNQELRAPIYKWLRGVVFIDAGSVGLSQRPSFGGLRVGYGAGIRLNTPFSILRLDLGRPTGDGKARWYFGLGHVF